MLSLLFFKNYLLSNRSGALVRMIAWLSMIGVSLGVAALIIVLSVMNGFNRTIRARMFVVVPHIVVPLPRHMLWGSMELEKRLSHSNIESIFPFESRDMIIRSQEGAFAGSIAKGYPVAAIADLLKRVGARTGSEAEALLPITAQLSRNEIIVGGDLARNLNVIDSDQVVLVPPESLLLPKGEMPKFQKYTIKGILASQLPEVDGQLLLYALPEDLSALGKVGVSSERGYEIRLHDPYDYAPVVKEIEKLGFKGVDWTKRDTALFFALRMEKFAMTLFLSLAVLITSFSIVMVMALVMSQKRRDIGMMMAMGLSERRTKGMFWRVGLLLGACGIGSGLLLGTFASVALHFYPLEILPDIYQDRTLPVDPNFSLVIGVLLGSGILAVIGSWLPVSRVRNLSPSHALRR